MGVEGSLPTLQKSATETYPWSNESGPILILFL